MHPNELRSRNNIKFIRTKKMKFTITVILLFKCYFTFSTTVNWNLNTLYGITQNGFSAIILDAKNHLLSNPNDTVIINIDAGVYNIGGNGSNGISISGLTPGVYGKLILKGAGINNTTLVFTEINQDMIRISYSENIVIADMHMTRGAYTVSQGFVQSIGTGYIDLDIQVGFPNPLQLYNNTSNQGRYLRRYTNSLTDPQVIQTNNAQIPWGYVNSVYTPPVLIGGNVWRFYLNNPSLLPSNYSIGDLVGVKSKHEGETYFIAGGNNIVFENIKWTHSTRGVSRFGASNIAIRKCIIERGDPINGQTPCMASPSGGPQMNQPNDSLATNMTVDSCFIESPGDDCVAFFNVDGGKCTNSFLKNSFYSRGIYIIPTALNICVANDSLINNVIVGPYVICPGLSVELQELQNKKILIYPNPGNEIFTISMDNIIQGKIEIYNIISELIYKAELPNQTTTIDLSKVEKGIYFVKIRDEIKNVFNNKIIIE